MSTTVKSGVREVFESMNPLKRFKKPKANPLTADRATVDTRAVAIGSDAVLLFREATKGNVTLDGRLTARRDEIEMLATGKQYDLAQTQLNSFRRDVEGSLALKQEAALFVDPPGMTPEETSTASLLRQSVAEDIDKLLLRQAADEVGQLSDLVSGAQMRDDLGLDFVADLLRRDIGIALPEGATAKEQVEAKKLRDSALRELNGGLTAEKVEKARGEAKAVVNVVAAIQRRLDVVGDNPRAQYDRLAMRMRDITQYPADFRSPAVTQLCIATGVADGDALTKLTAMDGAAAGKPREAAAGMARAAVDALRAKIEETLPVLRAHDTEVRAYFAALKKLAPQFKLADSLKAVDDGGTDTAWKTEREAYDASRAKVIGFQDNKKFREANAELATCRTKIDALLAKRRAPINTAIAAAADSDDAQQVIDDLVPEGLVAILTPQQQLDLLRNLPPGDAANEPYRIELFKNPAMDPAFVQAEAGVLKDVVRTLRGNDGAGATDESRQAKKDWQEHEENWAAWAGKDPKRPGEKDLPKLKAFFQKTAEMQFKKLITLAGLDPANLPPGFPSPPVTVELASLDPNDFGETSPVFPAVITMNSDHAMFGDFKEMIDTILHENAHAWQNMIVAQFKGTAPFRAQDTAKLNGATALPSMKLQAELFAQNDSSYFNSGASREAYRHEPLEEQAWTFGGKSSQALLVPQQPRSFDSAKGLQNKFWAVSSLARTAGANIRLKERHGIYVDEWQGERAADKKLTLEGVPGLSSSQPLVVQTVVDEYTLKLDLDATALRGRVVPAAEVKAEMEARATAAYGGRKLAALTDTERTAVRTAVLAAHGWVAEGNDADGTAVVRANDEVDVEHARLVLDERVAGLA